MPTIESARRNLPGTWIFDPTNSYEVGSRGWVRHQAGYYVEELLRAVLSGEVPVEAAEHAYVAMVTDTAS